MPVGLNPYNRYENPTRAPGTVNTENTALSGGAGETPLGFLGRQINQQFGRTALDREGSGLPPAQAGEGNTGRPVNNDYTVRDPRQPWTHPGAGSLGANNPVPGGGTPYHQGGSYFDWLNANADPTPPAEEPEYVPPEYTAGNPNDSQAFRSGYWYGAPSSDYSQLLDERPRLNLEGQGYPPGFEPEDTMTPEEREEEWLAGHNQGLGGAINTEAELTGVHDQTAEMVGTTPAAGGNYLGGGTLIGADSQYTSPIVTDVTGINSGIYTQNPNSTVLAGDEDGHYGQINQPMINQGESEEEAAARRAREAEEAEAERLAAIYEERQRLAALEQAARELAERERRARGPWGWGGR